VTVEATARWDRFPDAEFAVELELDRDQGRYKLTRLSVSEPSGIASADLHRYSVPKIVSAVASEAVVIDLDEAGLGPGGLTSMNGFLAQLDLNGNREKIAAEGPTSDTLALVALTYTYAWVVGLGPNEAVTSLLGVPKRTATRWIARARSDGQIVVNG